MGLAKNLIKFCFVHINALTFSKNSRVNKADLDVNSVGLGTQSMLMMLRPRSPNKSSHKRTWNLEIRCNECLFFCFGFVATTNERTMAERRTERETSYVVCHRAHGSIMLPKTFWEEKKWCSCFFHRLLILRLFLFYCLRYIKARFFIEWVN